MMKAKRIIYSCMSDNRTNNNYYFILESNPFVYNNLCYES